MDAETNTVDTKQNTDAAAEAAEKTNDSRDDPRQRSELTRRSLVRKSVNQYPFTSKNNDLGYHRDMQLRARAAQCTLTVVSRST